MHVPALLGRTGLPVDAVITPRHPLLRVRGISRRYVAESPEWASVVEKCLLTGEYALLLNVDEPGLLNLYGHSWHPDAVKFLPFAPDSDVASSIRSKNAFYEWCLRNGLAVPETHVCSSFLKACELQSRLPGTWLLKGDSGSGGQNVMRNPSEVQPDDGTGWKSGTWLVQRDEGNNVGSGIFLADQGRLLAWIGIKKNVCLNRGYGPTVFGSGDDSPDMEELCRRVAAASGVTGLTGFDFVRNAANVPLLIDSHLGRMSPMQHFDRLYGVDFPAALRAHLDGRDCRAMGPVPGPAFIKFPEVLQLAMQGDLGKLLKAADFSVKMPLCPPGDPLIALSSALNVLISQARVNIGRRRRIRARRHQP